MKLETYVRAEQIRSTIDRLEEDLNFWSTAEVSVNTICIYNEDAWNPVPVEQPTLDLLRQTVLENLSSRIAVLKSEFESL